jgi:hypothetical protein
MGNAAIVVPLEVNKGLFSNMPTTQIPLGGCSAVSNIIIKDGRLVARPGLTPKYLTLGAGIQVYHLARHITLTGTVYQIAVGRDSSTGALMFYYWTGSAWSNITGSVSITVASLASVPTSCTFKGYWFFTCGGSGNLVQWSGAGNVALTTNATPALAPHANPKWMMASNSRLFLVNIEDGSSNRIPYRVDWSDFLSYDKWNGGTGGGSSKYQDLLTESDPITGGIAVKDVIYVFKERYVYASASVGPPVYFSFRKLSTDKGCIAPRTLKTFKDSVVFLGDDNIYYLSGNDSKPIADNITTRFKAVFNSSYLNRSFAVIDKENYLYYLFIPKTSTDDLISFFTLSLKDGAWTESEIALPGTDIHYPYCGTDYHNGNWDTDLLIGSENTYVYELSYSTYTDNTTSFTPSWTSGVIDISAIFGQEIETAMLERVVVEAESGTYDVTLSHGMYLHNMETTQAVRVNLNKLNHPDYASFRIESKYFKLKLEMPDNTAYGQVSKIHLYLKPQKGILR